MLNIADFLYSRAVFNVHFEDDHVENFAMIFELYILEL